MYNKMKPIKWVIKNYSISESISGYLLTVLPYFGKNTIENNIEKRTLVFERTN